jgi:hypothetical protein
MKHFKHARIAIVIYATPDLLLQHSDETLQHTFETDKTCTGNIHE